MSDDINIGAITESLNDKADRDMQNVEEGLIGGGVKVEDVAVAGGGGIGSASLYWGKSGQISSSGETNFRILYCSIGEVLKPVVNPTSLSDLIPLYQNITFSSSNKKYVNLILVGMYVISHDKVVSLPNLKRLLNTESLYWKDLYQVASSSLTSIEENYLEGELVTLEIDALSTTKTTVSTFNLTRRANLRSETFKHGVGTEYVPSENFINKGLILGELKNTENSSFSVTCDIDTSLGETILFSNKNIIDDKYNYKIHLSVKDGKLQGILLPNSGLGNDSSDTVWVNIDSKDTNPQKITVSGDLNGIRTYSWTQTLINETHNTNRWKVTRASDSKIFWVEEEPVQDQAVVSAHKYVYDSPWKGLLIGQADENEFNFVKENGNFVRGTATYKASNTITCVDNNENSIFTATFKLHTPIKSKIECFNSAHYKEDFSVTLLESVNNGVTLPEFYSINEDDITQIELTTLQDGTYLVLADSLSSSTYTIVDKRNVSRIKAGLLINKLLSEKVILGSFDIFDNCIVSAWKYPQIQ